MGMMSNAPHSTLCQALGLKRYFFSSYGKGLMTSFGYLSPGLHSPSIMPRSKLLSSSQLKPHSSLPVPSSSLHISNALFPPPFPSLNQWEGVSLDHPSKARTDLCFLLIERRVSGTGERCGREQERKSENAGGCVYRWVGGLVVGGMWHRGWQRGKERGDQGKRRGRGRMREASIAGQQ